METAGLRCDQLVTVDNCCTPTVCHEPASHAHEASGLSLCATHYGNAVKYGFDGTWTVGTTNVPFPDGWAAVADTSEAPSLATAASDSQEVRPSGLVIETAPLSSSGLVLER